MNKLLLKKQLKGQKESGKIMSFLAQHLIYNQLSVQQIKIQTYST